MFRMFVLTRAWNAEHGGVYVPVGARSSPTKITMSGYKRSTAPSALGKNNASFFHIMIEYLS
jgi:hypothetical protein